MNETTPGTFDQAAFQQERARLVEGLGYEVVENKGKFISLSKNGYSIELKHFPVPSEFGYKNGKLSAINIENDNGPVILWDLSFMGGEDEETEVHEEQKAFIGVPEEAVAIFKELVEALN
jgi:hypothetical protein